MKYDMTRKNSIVFPGSYINSKSGSYWFIITASTIYGANAFTASLIINTVIVVVSSSVLCFISTLYTT